jgi:hypothetical protein
MNLLKEINKLCSPSKLYFYLSLVSILALFVQNCQNQNMYCLGLYKTYTKQYNIIYFIMKILYALFWTWVLNKLCKKGYTNVSWFLVLLPYLGMFILAGMLFLALQSQL